MILTDAHPSPRILSAHLIDKVVGRNESLCGPLSFVPKHTPLWAETLFPFQALEVTNDPAS